MGDSNICQQNHRYNPSFETFPEYQGTNSRHKCAACAYDLGYSHAINGIPEATNDSVLADVKDSQAGNVRHKNAFIAYQEGYKSGSSKKD